MENNNSNNKVMCIICGILTVFGIVANIISLAGGSKGIWTVNDVADIVVCILIGYYAFIGYRKPHGNLLKYIILLYAATRIISVYLVARLGSPWLAVNRAMIIGLCCYIAGRLHKVKQNIILMSVVAVLILVRMILDQMAGVFTTGAITPLIIWSDIFVAYVLRYKEHKEAGLMDAEKK